MKVLLIVTDLYRTIGGGQTVYKKIVEATPDIEFYYFREREQKNAFRPSNAKPIPLCAYKNINILSPPPVPNYRIHALIQANRFARSVAGQSFDCVDLPDFYSFGSVLRDAFFHHRVSVGQIILAMHGNISVSMAMNFDSTDDNVLEQCILEQDQFIKADGVYALSRYYLRQWKKRVDRSIHYIDPIHFVNHVKNSDTYKPSTNPINLYCIGRMERRKGNDLFIELVRWLNPVLYDQATHIGDVDYSHHGINSQSILECIAKKRDLTLEFQPSYQIKQLQQLFCQRSLIILPVRYDTLNLVALEALFSGCPVAISSEAGVCDYLDEAFPKLPYIRIDFNNFYQTVPKLEAVLRNYDQYRSKLQTALATIYRGLPTTLAMRTIYHMSNAAKNISTDRFYYAEIDSIKAPAKQLTQSLLPIQTMQSVKQCLRNPKAYLVKKIRNTRYFQKTKFYNMLLDARHIPDRLQQISKHSEHNLMELRKKLNRIYINSGNPLYRCNFWLDIARIERIRGNELIAVTYELRVLRLLGQDTLNILPRVIDTLNKQGLLNEARAASIMYSDPQTANESIYHFLHEAYQNHQSKPALSFSAIDDRRNGNPKVSVIVSLYKAEKQLKVFLTTLQQQTLMRDHQVELILIDSASPDNTAQLIQTYWKNQPMNAVYARSEKRETIQAAWNRGIQLARAPYLVFLGTDETLYPEALELLADELDRQPTIDWVMSNSLVTEVDERGVYKNDVMCYQRNCASKDHAYLETCYVSWVGGMYRKTIHQRFGYYDETFSAAGDTEFKNRILAHINVKFIPKTLGLFLNYPSTRVTASPRAEIEDLRAWYTYRTLGGVRYAFESRSQHDIEHLIQTALGYRKFHCEHLSSDIEYASYLVSYLNEKKMAADWIQIIKPDLNKMLDLMRAIEYTPVSARQQIGMNLLLRTWRVFLAAQKRHTKLLAQSGATPHYQFCNDNRYEQHAWLWKSTQLK